jgi:hypothetical protein
MKRFNQFFSIIILLTGIAGCAIEMAPTGGVQDKEPPKFLSANPENESLNFKGKRIKVKFDEYLDFSINPAEIQVSPEMENAPLFYVENKTLNIILKDSLRKNTTYNFQFGSSIKDLSEKNVLENFSYCFSTGDSLDTGFIGGKIENRVTLKAPENCVVGIYADSNYTKKPLYFSKSNADGSFTFKNIKTGNYNLIAYEDINGNKVFDYRDGDAGFYENQIELRDTVKEIKIGLFHAERKRNLKVDKKADLNLVAFKKPEIVKSVNADPLMQVFKFYQNETKDTLFIWSKTQRDSAKYSIEFEDTIITIKEKTNNIADTAFLEWGKFGSTSPLAQTTLIANHPIEKTDFSKIKILEDSLTVIERNKIKNENSFRSIMLSFTKKENKDYYLIFSDSSMLDVFGNYSKEQIMKIRTGSENEYGNLIMKVENTLKEAMIIELYEESGKLIERKAISEENQKIKFSNLNKGLYKAIGTIDKNNNGYWDSGNFDKRIQPEKRILLKEKIEIKGGWDIEAEIKL